MFIILECFMLDAACNPLLSVVNNVINLHNLLLCDTSIES